MIGHHGTSPLKRANEKILKQKFKANNYLYNGTASQFPKFLRGEDSLNNSKRKNKKRKS